MLGYLDLYNQGRIREEGMQLTITPTCEQKLLFIAICYLCTKLYEICTFPVTFLRPFGFCSWTVVCPLLLYALDITEETELTRMEWSNYTLDLDLRDTKIPSIAIATIQYVHLVHLVLELLTSPLWHFLLKNTHACDLQNIVLCAWRSLEKKGE